MKSLPYSNQKIKTMLDHEYNKNGFCIHCGWQKGYIKRTNRRCVTPAEAAERSFENESRKEAHERLIAPYRHLDSEQDRLRQIFQENQERSGQKAIVWGVVIIIIMVFLACLSFGPSTSTSDGVFEAATEKLNKGIPLNEREAKRIDDILRFKERERAKEIERRHGER